MSLEPNNSSQQLPQPEIFVGTHVRSVGNSAAISVQPLAPVTNVGQILSPVDVVAERISPVQGSGLYQAKAQSEDDYNPGAQALDPFGPVSKLLEIPSAVVDSLPDVAKQSASKVVKAIPVAGTVLGVASNTIEADFAAARSVRDIGQLSHCSDLITRKARL